MSGLPVPQVRQTVREAARWLALLESGSASPRDLGELQRWRERCVSHEQAWQKAQGLRQRFSQLPAALALASLDRPDPDRRALLKRMLAIGALAPTTWLAYRQLPVATWRADLRTATGERRELRLPDGSLLQLNTASAVDVDFREGRRELTLVEGEIALNVVEHNPLRVHVRQGQLIATQAEFCVRQMEQGCRVSVLRGSVRLQPLHAAALTLSEGQWVELSAHGIGRLQDFDTRRPGWRQGVLMVEDQPLGVFLGELERYRPGILRWEPALEVLAVTGTFRLDNTDRVLALLAASLPLEVQYRTRYWVSLASRESVG